MSRARANLITGGVLLGILLTLGGATAWAVNYSTAPVPTRATSPRVAHLDALPAPVTPSTVVQVPVPPVAAQSNTVAQRLSHVAVPAPVPTTTTTTASEYLRSVEPNASAVTLIPSKVTERPACPAGGSVFAYGTCELPEGVHDSGADLAPNGQPVATEGAPSKLVTVCGELVLRPATYQAPAGTLTCNPEVGR